jgi:hypothetical protein
MMLNLPYTTSNSPHGVLVWDAFSRYEFLISILIPTYLQIGRIPATVDPVCPCTMDVFQLEVLNQVFLLLVRLLKENLGIWNLSS